MPRVITSEAIETIAVQNYFWTGKRKNIKRRDKYFRSLKSNLLKSTQISVVLGARRVGKTYLIYDLIQDLIETEDIEAKNVFYCILNHAHFSGLDIIDLIRAYRTVHNLPREQEVYLFLDEVQHIKDWDQQVANLYDSEQVKVLVSGSSSTLIKNQSNFLTGRQKRFHIYPLDFSEFINFKNYQLTLAESYRFEPILKEYLEVGGFPEWVLERDESYLSELLDAVLFKDVVSIYPVTNAKLLKDLLRWLAVQLTKPLSYSKITNIMGEKSDKTVKQYLGYLIESYLILECPRFSYKLGEQITSPNKFYFTDIGNRNSLNGGLKDQEGLVAENALYLHLCEKYGQENVFYWAVDKSEIDFVVQLGGFDVMLIESKFSDRIDNDTMLKGMNNFLSGEYQGNVTKAMVVTRNLEKTDLIQGREVEFKPLYRMLFENVA
ncbi:MAG: ATP-binding protein [Iphinoe sp. HA4291-MV1]|jgi:hypothetical protein|nr:ATP-binding protein [Iphinoe sp. HA4291-MV1]